MLFYISLRSHILMLGTEIKASGRGLNPNTVYIKRNGENVTRKLFTLPLTFHPGSECRAEMRKFRL